MNQKNNMQVMEQSSPVLASAIRVGAELVGTFMLCFAIYASLSWGRLSTGASSIAAALAWVLAVIAVGSIFGKISGAHFNPAITFAAMFTSQLGWIEGLCYIVSQIVGAIGAGALITYLLPIDEVNNGKVWLLGAVNGFEQGGPLHDNLQQYNINFSITMAIVAELIASIIVVGTAINTMNAKGYEKNGHVWKMALAYGAGAMITFPLTGSGMNPARSTGIALFARNKGLVVDPVQQLLVFWICPFLAAAIVGLVTILFHILLDSVVKKAESTTPETPLEMPDALLNSNEDASNTEQGATNSEALLEVETIELTPEETNQGLQESSSNSHFGQYTSNADSAQNQKDTEISQQKSSSQTEADKGIEAN